MGQARTRGASQGSTNLTFEPGEVRPGSYHSTSARPAATGLVLHTIYLPLALHGGHPAR